MLPKDEKKKSNFGAGPWIMKKKQFDDFRKVTTQNWPNANVMGRILYIIEVTGKNYLFRGTMTIEPCFRAGWVRFPFKPWMQGYPGYQSVKMDTDMNYNDYVKTNKALIHKYIAEETLFINPNDPILTFYQD